MSRNKPKSRVKTAKGRKVGSTIWLQRQLNDPYVSKAREQGWRGRAAFKLLELDEKLDLLKSGQVVVDLGAAPGGWCQVATQKGCRVVAIDLLPVDEMADMNFIQMDFMEDEAPEKLKSMIKNFREDGLADLVLSDMAPNTTGHKQTDHLRIMAIVEAAFHFACDVLTPGGTFVAKVFQGGAQNTLVAIMNKNFEKVRHVKPPASRKESSETYVIATGYKGPHAS
ncbi:MAG: RlmE family RNA methyltransferase [Alphaproteobacteria bacterium]|nr:RlmE family RNA methyltransferase [Alphaproteobacteria bacterium]